VVESHVYVIAAGNSAVKVGIAKDTKKRLKALQTGHHELLRICDSVVCSGEYLAMDVEREAHRLLSAKRLEGEWFDVRPEDALSAIQQAFQVVKGQASLVGALRARRQVSPVVERIYKGIGVMNATDVAVACLIARVVEAAGQPSELELQSVRKMDCFPISDGAIQESITHLCRFPLVWDARPMSGNFHFLEHYQFSDRGKFFLVRVSDEVVRIILDKGFDGWFRWLTWQIAHFDDMLKEQAA
jgi:hypothetical protein